MKKFKMRMLMDIDILEYEILEMNDFIPAEIKDKYEKALERIEESKKESEVVDHLEILSEIKAELEPLLLQEPIERIEEIEETKTEEAKEESTEIAVMKRKRGFSWQ